MQQWTSKCLWPCKGSKLTFLYGDQLVTYGKFCSPKILFTLLKTKKQSNKQKKKQAWQQFSFLLIRDESWLFGNLFNFSLGYRQNKK